MGTVSVRGNLSLSRRAMCRSELDLRSGLTSGLRLRVGLGLGFGLRVAAD